MAKRSYGTGQLYEKSGAYYGRWRTGTGRRLNRKVGRVRTPGEDDGLTRSQAEREFRPACVSLRCSPTSSPLDRSKLSKRFKAACRDAGVREVKFHDLRHTFVTRLAASGQPMRTIQEFLGHADSKTTRIYAHYAPSEHEVQMVNEAFAPDVHIRSVSEAAVGDE
jgi:integrase